MRKTVPWIALGAVVIGALVVVLANGGSHSNAARVRELAAEIRCPDCESLSVADSATPAARAARADIRQRVDHGESDAQIRQIYVDRYGESILLKPQSDGLGLLVWGLPVAALLVGAGGLVLVLRKWRRQPRMTATEADRDLVEQVRQ